MLSVAWACSTKTYFAWIKYSEILKEHTFLILFSFKTIFLVLLVETIICNYKTHFPVYILKPTKNYSNRHQNWGNNEKSLEIQLLNFNFRSLLTKYMILNNFISFWKCPIFIYKTGLTCIAFITGLFHRRVMPL